MRRERMFSPQRYDFQPARLLANTGLLGYGVPPLQLIDDELFELFTCKLAWLSTQLIGKIQKLFALHHSRQCFLHRLLGFFAKGVMSNQAKPGSSDELV